VGRIRIQQDYEDYRAVNGVKFPFKYSFLWLDGRFTALISDVKVNVRSTQRSSESRKHG
jgi:hypothetical protein